MSKKVYVYSLIYVSILATKKKPTSQQQQSGFLVLNLNGKVFEIQWMNRMTHFTYPPIYLFFSSSPNDFLLLRLYSQYLQFVFFAWDCKTTTVNVMNGSYISKYTLWFVYILANITFDLANLSSRLNQSRKRSILILNTLFRVF